jgi:hypothetical protein
LAKENKSIALLEFETKGDVSKAIARGITLILQSQLVNTGQFTVFETVFKKEKIDNILKKDGGEFKLQVRAAFTKPVAGLQYALSVKTIESKDISINLRVFDISNKTFIHRLAKDTFKFLTL